LSDADGPSSILAIIDEKRDIIRNESLLLTQALIEGNIEIQKALAFESIFEKLLSITSKEGGIEGGIVSQDCLVIIDGLLRYNPSNQLYFRELSLPAALPSLLLYPSPPPPPDQPTPQEFALQFWDAQKLQNANIVINVIGILSRGKGVSQVRIQW
jgi:intracellular protein transport protein USO1